MCAQFNTTNSRSFAVYRMHFACLALVAISVSTFATLTRADDPTPPGSVTISLSQFSVMHLGNDQWYAEGLVEAEHPTEVTVQFSGAATSTTSPNSGGYFWLTFNAPPLQYLYVDVTDDTGTDHGEVFLDDFSL